MHTYLSVVLAGGVGATGGTTATGVAAVGSGKGAAAMSLLFRI